MVRDIVKDPIMLSIKSAPADTGDIQIAEDLLDTIDEHIVKDQCVGMAANMIGFSKRIIVFLDEDAWQVMYNPRMIKSTQPYQIEEGCLCLKGTRLAKRFMNITVAWQDQNMAEHVSTFSGLEAQIIQHEMDHLEGILI